MAKTTKTLSRNKTMKAGNKKIIRLDPGSVENSGDYGWAIVVADRGFVWIGDTVKLGDSFYMANVQNIRQWGTKKGLGELATEGPKSETEMDPVPCVIVPARAVLAIIPAVRSVWPA